MLFRKMSFALFFMVQTELKSTFCEEKSWKFFLFLAVKITAHLISTTEVHFVVIFYVGKCGMNWEVHYVVFM